MSIGSPSFISTDSLLAHWQGHRRLTRKVIDAFPDDRLFSFSVGEMRPFGALALEMITMAVPMVRGAISGEWNYQGGERKTFYSTDGYAKPKSEILRLWDEATAQLDELWPRIPAERFQETLNAFGQYPGVLHDLILYVIDNEVHHRGQGYVYLRALKIEPPAFYDRS